MVIILENWETFKMYVEKWPLVELMYSVEEVSKDLTRIRIVAGRYGVDLTLAGNTASLNEVMEFLQRKSAKRTVEVIPDVETFFSR